MNADAEPQVVAGRLERRTRGWKLPGQPRLTNKMLGHTSAAMTLDVYAGLFADDLDAVADRLDRAFAKLNADQMRTKQLLNRSNQAALLPEQAAG